MSQEKTILFISKRATAPSTRYRVLQYASLFKNDGWRFCHIADDRSLLTRKRILQEAKNATVVVIVRRTYSYPFFKLLRHYSNFLVFDFDDAVFQASSGAKSSRRQKNFARIVKFADLVWAGNGYLADNAQKYNKNVVVVPTSLEVDKYNAFAKKPQNTFDLVWIGSSSTKKHLTSALPAFENAAQIIPSLCLKVVSDFGLSSDILTIHSVPWSEESEAEQLLSAHVGVAPLPDNPFTKGKCALKVIQYMAAALPVISSPTGMNKEIVKPGVNGFLAANSDEWVASITQLFNDEKLRTQMGDVGKKMCSDNYTLQATFQKMVSSIEKELCRQ